MHNVIQFGATFNKNHAPYLNQAQLLYALLEVHPGAQMVNMRLPLNFSLVLDRSGSMSGKKIERLQEAVKWILEQLQPDDIVSIIAFDHNTTVLVEAAHAGDRKLQQQVDKLKASGGTKMGPAMRAGLEEVARYHGHDRVSRLILLTDGDTDGKSDCEYQADAAAQMGVPIIALGLGNNWKEDFLIELAQRSGSLGYADLIKNPEDASTIFQEVYSRMQIVAQDLMLRLLLVQGLEARRVWQVTPLIKDISYSAIEGRTIVVESPELEEGGAAFLVELLIPPRPPGRYRLVQAEVSYTLPGQEAFPEKQSQDMMIEVTDDPVASQQVNGRVMNIVEKVTAFKLQTQALDEAAAGNIAGATRKLRAAHTRLLEQGEVELAQTALEEAERLEQGQGISDKGNKTIKLQSRKTVRLSEEKLI